MKLATICSVTLFACGAALCSQAMADSVEEKYKKSCHICHDTGVANAPKVHDVEAWKPRLDKGMDTLVSSIKNGLNAMPPGGMCADCSDEDYKALIEFMSKPKR
ncbi:hypothetical protein Mag101_13940 [Microbulbifer agarilyticus]|uniref:Cytochrome c domain-containing protein n=1 Tax=Microbulbifer agarilyticus TaxID=260552 RepID=A0A1Q2MA67_9GAMM|nr:c-type cytochrome [Microbulbifer agarilyticus]AQQ69591.1 hypothetical protein Mag101_13940 [Microbulbifer agarilyticus]